VKELIEYIARALVDHPNEVVVKEIAGEKTLIYELKVAPGDQGKVIGKEGHTAKAIRAIIAASAMKIGKRAQLEILE
jgi:predicted RNA-binding protein YlqC (UPF0109 family)